ncbi:MAG: YezD family protein [Akkermansiaceae bacterium]|nr:YezD family protein [Verrucomicrobiales bacterium]
MKIEKTESLEVNEPAWLETVKRHVDSLRFGVVQITVHEGKPVQIERTERVRLDKLQNH